MIDYMHILPLLLTHDTIHFYLQQKGEGRQSVTVLSYSHEISSMTEIGFVYSKNGAHWSNQRVTINKNNGLGKTV